MKKYISYILNIWSSDLSMTYYTDINNMNIETSKYNLYYSHNLDYFDKLNNLCLIDDNIKNKVIEYYNRYYDFYGDQDNKINQEINSEINSDQEINSYQEINNIKNNKKTINAKSNKSRHITESVKKLVAGSQYYKCANNNNNIVGLNNYKCPLWSGHNKGSFDESGYEIDHIIEYSISHDNSIKNLQALCRSCHMVKTKRFMHKK